METSTEHGGAVLSSRRQLVMLDIPEDFLRIPGAIGDRHNHDLNYEQPLQTEGIPGMHQQAVDIAVGAAAARAIARGSNIQGKLSVTMAQAKLGKNYGLTRMDPYARIRIGHYVFETDTDSNGSTNPRWDKTFTCFVPPGITSVYVEIFDERTFSMDERIAWGHFTIPQRVFEGDALDDWWQLSGKQGEQKEGMIELVFSYERVQIGGYAAPRQMVLNPAYTMPGIGIHPYVTPPGGAQDVHVQQRVLPPAITDDDVKQLKEMFPDVDDEVIRSVLEEKLNNKSAAINALLSMTS